MTALNIRQFCGRNTYTAKRFLSENACFTYRDCGSPDTLEIAKPIPAFTKRQISLDKFLFK